MKTAMVRLRRNPILLHWKQVCCQKIQENKLGEPVPVPMEYPFLLPDPLNVLAFPQRINRHDLYRKSAMLHKIIAVSDTWPAKGLSHNP